MPGEMVPIILFVIMGVVGLPVGLAYSPIGAALARRMSGGKDTALEAEVEALKAELDALRSQLEEGEARLARQLEETNGRIDFAERVIAQNRPKDALPGAR